MRSGLTFYAMLECVLHEDEELDQLRIVITEGATQAHGGLNKSLDRDLQHVEQVGPLHHPTQEQGV